MKSEQVNIRGGRRMKIDKLDNLTNLLMPDKKGSTHKAGGADFQKILEETQADQAAESQKLSESGSVFRAAGIPDGPLGVYSFPPLTELGNPFQTQARSLQTADQVLRVLEEYQKSLADPEVSLKNLYPMIQSLSSEIQGVSQDAEKLPANDPLKRILREMGILAAVEVEKFNRGEYVS
jgi:hypothetical protein